MFANGILEQVSWASKQLYEKNYKNKKLRKLSL